VREEEVVSRPHCDAECPGCGLHAGDAGGPVMVGPTPESEVRLDALMLRHEAFRTELEVVLYCGACRIPWLGHLTAEDEA
jgi:hypothetical protein